MTAENPFEAMDKRVFIVGGAPFSYIKLFRFLGYHNAQTIDEADVVCFTGGSDVTPALYGEKKLPRTSNNPDRDHQEAEAFGYALGLKKFMVGICRGGQFLNVMNGGKMWQDCDGHGINHQVMDIETGNWIWCSSTHHQMIRPTKEALIVAIARKSDVKENAERVWVRAQNKSYPGQFNMGAASNEPGDDVDVEACFYPSSRSLCFQPHPEHNNVKECTAYFGQQLERFRKVA